MTCDPARPGHTARVATRIKRVAGVRGPRGGRVVPEAVARDYPPSPGHGLPGGVGRRPTVTMVPQACEWRTVTSPDVTGQEPVAGMPGAGLVTARRLIAEALRVPRYSFNIDLRILDPAYNPGPQVLRMVEIGVRDEGGITEAHRVLSEISQDAPQTEADLLRAYDDLNLTIHSLLEILDRPVPWPTRRGTSAAGSRPP